MTLTWAVQTNLGKADAADLLSACKKVGCPTIELTAIPFNFAPLPALPEKDPTIFWGSVGFVRPIWASKKWNPGVILNDNFNYEVWSQKWKGLCLNEGQVTTLEDFEHQQHHPETLFFIRPCADDKSFTGQVISFGELGPWMSNILGAGLGFEKTPILVAEPVGISREWRTYILNQSMVTGSLYKKDFKSIRSSEVPQEVVNFAEKIARIWSPADLFTLDIAESGDGLFVNEMGSFNSAGFYKSDLPKLVKEISDFYGA